MAYNAKAAQSINEFCEDNDIGRTTTYGEIKAGRLRTMKVGKRTLITHEAAADWRHLMERRTAEAAA